MNKGEEEADNSKKVDPNKITDIKAIIKNEFDKEIELKHKEIESIKENIKKAEALLGLIKSSIENSSKNADNQEWGLRIGPRFKTRTKTRTRSNQNQVSLQGKDFGYRQRLETTVIARLHNDNISNSLLNTNAESESSSSILAKKPRTLNKKPNTVLSHADFLKNLTNPESCSISNIKKLLNSQQRRELDLTVQTILNPNNDDLEADNSESDEEASIQATHLSKINSYAQLHKSYLPPRSLLSTGTNTAASQVQPKKDPIVIEPTAKYPTSNNAEGGTNLRISKPRESRFHVIERVMVGNESRHMLPEDKIPGDLESTHIWTVYVRKLAGGAELDTYIKKVRVFLHPSYRPNDVVDIIMPPFELSRPGWGEFPLRIQVYFIDKRNKPVNIVHILKLSSFFSDGVVLGSEQAIDLELNKVIEKSSTSLAGLRQTPIRNTSILNLLTDKSDEKNQTKRSNKTFKLDSHIREEQPEPCTDLPVNQALEAEKLDFKLKDYEIKSESVTPEPVLHSGNSKINLQYATENDLALFTTHPNPELTKAASLGQEQFIDVWAGSNIDFTDCSSFIQPGRTSIKLKTFDLGFLNLRENEPKKVQKIKVKESKAKEFKAEEKKAVVKVTKTPREVKETLLDQTRPELLEKIVKFIKMDRRSIVCDNLILNHIFLIFTKCYPLVESTKITSPGQLKPLRPSDKIDSTKIMKRYQPAESLEQWEKIWSAGHRLFVENSRAWHIYKELQATFDGYDLMDPRIEVNFDLVSDPDEFLYYVMELLDKFNFAENEIDAVVHDVLVSKPDDMVHAVKTIQRLYCGKVKHMLQWLREFNYSLVGKLLVPIVDDQPFLPDMDKEIIHTSKATKDLEPTAANFDLLLSDNPISKPDIPALDSKLTKPPSLESPFSVGLSILERELGTQTITPYTFYCKNCGNLKVEDFYLAMERSKNTANSENSTSKGDAVHSSNFFKNSMLFCSEDCMSIWYPIHSQSGDSTKFGSYSTMSSVSELFDMYPKIFNRDKDIHNLTNQTPNVDSISNQNTPKPDGLGLKGIQSVLIKPEDFGDTDMSVDMDVDAEIDVDIEVDDSLPVNSDSLSSEVSSSKDELRKLSMLVQESVYQRVYRKDESQPTLNPSAIDWIWESLRPLELSTTVAARATGSEKQVDELGYYSTIGDLEESALEQRVVVGDLLYNLATIFLKDLVASSLECLQDSTPPFSITKSGFKKRMLLPTHILSALSKNPNSFDFITNAFMGDGS